MSLSVKSIYADLVIDDFFPFTSSTGPTPPTGASRMMYEETDPYATVYSSSQEDIQLIDPTPVFESYSEASSSGNVGSLQVPMPSGTTEGDLIVAVFTHDSSSGTLSSPADWTDLFSTLSTGGSTLLVSYKIAESGESGSYTFSSTDSDQLACGIARFSGVDTSNPINSQSNTNTGNNQYPECLASTTTVENTLVLRIMGADDDDYSTPGNYPSGHTGAFTVQSTGRYGETHCAMAYVKQASAGSTGTASFSMTRGEQWGTITVTLTPAPDRIQNLYFYTDRYPSTGSTADFTDPLWEVKIYVSATSSGNTLKVSIGLTGESVDTTEYETPMVEKTGIDSTGQYTISGFDFSGFPAPISASPINSRRLFVHFKRGTYDITLRYGDDPGCWMGLTTGTVVPENLLGFLFLAPLIPFVANAAAQWSEKGRRQAGREGGGRQ